MRSTVILFTLTALALTLFSCKKETEEYTDGQPLSDYFNLQPGKYITYRTDSTVFPSAGRSIATYYFQEKHIINDIVPDALGRNSYRVFRYTRDTAGTQSWSPSGTYFITPIVDPNTRLYTRVEILENNLRVIKLAKSVKVNQTWKGNEYLGNDPYATIYGPDFQQDNNLAQWDFTIIAANESATIRGQVYNNVITMQAANELDNVLSSDPARIVDPNRLATATVSVDKYAKGIGLIYQEMTLWERQPPTTTATAYYNGFSVIRKIIDHN